jgi:hypothetical protein
VRATKRGSLTLGPLLLALTIAACGGDDDKSSTSRAGSSIDPAGYSATVDHPLIPLASVPVTIFKGKEGDTETRAVNRVLRKSERVAGVPVATVDVREWENGKLVEHTSDYFARSKDGNVWYFGERVDNIEGGKVTGHEGQWLAGEGRAKPGLFMPAKPKVGQVFQQERAPGVAEDRSTVVAVGLKVTTAAGKFNKCIKTKDYSPLDKVTEFKYYCAGVGLVREGLKDGREDLVRYR